MFNIITRLRLTVTLLLFSTIVVGQKGVEVGAHLGLSHYYGDLNPTFKISDPGFSAGFFVRRNFNERICVTLGFDYGNVSGNDQDSFNPFERTRNLDFRSKVYDTSFALEFNFLPYIHGSSDYNFTPYLFSGLSAMRFNPKTDLNGVTYNLQQYFTESEGNYGLLSGAWVYGFGLKWDINRDFSFNASLSGRNLFSDYIDDVSGTYPAPSQSIDGQLSNRSGGIDFGQQGTQRGNGLNNDTVYFVRISLVRYFGQLKCPSIYDGQY